MLTRTQLHKLRRTPLGASPNKLQIAMDLADVTQLDIQAATKIPQSYVSRIKRGAYSQRGLPGGTMGTLAGFFGCQIEDLFPPAAREAVA
jgi:hypothetical protein